MLPGEKPLPMYKDTEVLHKLKELSDSTMNKITEEVYDALGIIFPCLRKFRSEQDIHLYFMDEYPEDNRESIWFGEDFGKTRITFKQLLDSVRYTPFQANLKLFLNCYLKKGVLGLPSFETVTELKMKLKLMGYETFSSDNPLGWCKNVYAR